MDIKIDPNDAHQTVIEVATELKKEMDIKGLKGFVSTHECYGMIAEEFGELLDALRKNDLAQFKAELIDLAIASIWSLASVKNLQ